MSSPVSNPFAGHLSTTLRVTGDKTVTLDEIRKCTSSSSLTRNLNRLLLYMSKGVLINDASLGKILSNGTNHGFKQSH